MKKIFLLIFLFGLATYASEPKQLSEVHSKELFLTLAKWQTVKNQKIQVSSVICIENLEDRRQLGCSLYDELYQKDRVKNNRAAEPLYVNLSKHMDADCDDTGDDDSGDGIEDSNTCSIVVEKVSCSIVEGLYDCVIE